MLTVLIVVLAVALMVLMVAMCKAAGRADEDAERMAAAYTPTTHEPTSDAVLLAKVMQIRSGDRWPDWLCMLVGETIMNRVESWRYPNTIEEVIYDSRPVYFTETYTAEWADLVPDAEYIDLAERLISGERALGNRNMLYTGSSPEGTGVLVSYYDKAAEQMVYFCRG